MISQKELQETWPELADRIWHILNSPKNPDISQDEYIEWQLDRFCVILDTLKPWAHGVEVIRLEGGYELTEGRSIPRSWYYRDTIAYYVNRGDAYNTTIIFDVIKQEFVVSCVADWTEANIQPYKIEEARQKWAEYNAIPKTNDDLLPMLAEDWGMFEAGELTARVLAWFQRQYGDVTYHTLLGDL